jgi:hypothetical protein
VDLALEVRKTTGFGKRSMVQIGDFNVNQPEPQPEPAPPPAPVPPIPWAESIDYDPARTEVMRARCQRMVEANPAAANALDARWPAGVPSWIDRPGFAYGDHELDAIEAVVAEGEAAMGLAPITQAELRERRPEALGAELAAPEIKNGQLVEHDGVLKSYNATTKEWEPAGPQADGTFLDPQGTSWKPDPSGHWFPQSPGPGLHAFENVGADGNTCRCGSPEHHPDHRPTFPAIPPKVWGEVPPAPSRDELDARRPYSGPAATPPPPAVEPDPETAAMGETIERIKTTFPGTTVMETIRHKDPATVRLAERIATLPADLRGELDGKARRAQLPNLGTPGYKVDEETFALLCHWLDQAEEKLAGRILAFTDKVPETAHAFLAHHVLLDPFEGLDKVTADQLDAMRCLYLAGELGIVRLHPGDSKSLEVNPEHTKALTKKITDAHGAAAAVKLAGNRWATALGRPDAWRTSTMKAAAAHPIIGPCLAFGRAVFSPDAVEAPDDPTPEVDLAPMTED